MIQCASPGSARAGSALDSYRAAYPGSARAGSALDSYSAAPRDQPAPAAPRPLRTLSVPWAEGRLGCLPVCMSCCLPGISPRRQRLDPCARLACPGRLVTNRTSPWHSWADGAAVFYKSPTLSLAENQAAVFVCQSNGSSSSSGSEALRHLQSLLVF